MISLCRMRVRLVMPALLVLLVGGGWRVARGQGDRVLRGEVVTRMGEVVTGAPLRLVVGGAERLVVTDGAGRFEIRVPPGEVKLTVGGERIVRQTYLIGKGIGEVRLMVELVVPAVYESLVITGVALDPAIDQRNGQLYRGTLFGRDDQLIQTLNAGISAGQHEGGGKSLEIRRFGFNLDHGGVNGGLKIMVDNMPQNQGTQGHGQGYLGQMKSLIPELVEDVDILNGPFSAAYGDFSGLGVVQIRMKESLDDWLTLRGQGGSFGARRLMAAWSPELEEVKGVLAYDGSYTDGPFISPARYRRENLTGSLTQGLGQGRAAGLKFNLGLNRFDSSGQIPLDEVAAGRLDRFGVLDPDNGGRAWTGYLSGFYRVDLADGGALKIDGYLGRSLFDLWSNFTGHLLDEEFGDEIQQHDSRWQEGGNVQYLRPVGGAAGSRGWQGLLMAGGAVQATQVNVGLWPSIGRSPHRLEANLARGSDNPDVLLTGAQAGITNSSGYLQQTAYLPAARLRLEGGLRYDYFRYAIVDGLNRTPLATERFAGVVGQGRWQPKAAAVFTPAERLPLTLHLNYGRGIASLDARGAVQRPEGTRLATTDFHQASLAWTARRFAVSANYFLIDNSNAQVYIPDDGSFEFLGASRANGYEVKLAAAVTRRLTFSGGLTQVLNAFYRGTWPRLYVDRAPHRVADARLTWQGRGGLLATINWRHTGSYRLDGADASIRAAGLDVLDLALRQPLRSWLDFNLSIDNLTDKRYFETQNFYESRPAPGAPVQARIHGTPGYARTLTVGMTLRLPKRAVR